MTTSAIEREFADEFDRLIVPTLLASGFELQTQGSLNRVYAFGTLLIRFAYNPRSRQIDVLLESGEGACDLSLVLTHLGIPHNAASLSASVGTASAINAVLADVASALLALRQPLFNSTPKKIERMLATACRL